MSGAGATVGKVRAVCLGPGGIPKHPVDEAECGALGLVGDKHRFKLHGGADRAVCIFGVEDREALARDGVAAGGPGAYGENLLLEGLDFQALRADDELEVGDEVVLAIHDVREPCNTLRSIDRRFPDLMLGRSGFVCRVLRGGKLRPGMQVRVRPGGAA